jgi:hypothetical protein
VQSNVSSPVAAILRVASLTICLIVIASFLIFAIDETNGASNHQQAVLNGTASAPGAPSSAPASSAPTPPAKESGIHKAIDDAANELTSPFSGVTSKSSEWMTRSVNTMLALLIYGFGLGYLARVLRVRT